MDNVELISGTDSVEAPKPTTVVIRRYQNRKLYSPTNSKYVTLSYVYELIKEGRKVTVINNLTQEDITTSILLAAISEASRGADNSTVADILEHLAKYLKGE